MILQKGKNSWSFLSNNIAPTLTMRSLKVGGRHARLKDILVWKHLVSFTSACSLTLMLPWCHVFVQKLMKVAGIGIVTPRLRFMVWKVVFRVLELLLGSQYWRIVWIIWKVCQLNYKEEILTYFRHTQWLTISNRRFNVRRMILV